MTTLICWVGVDSRGVASAYLASDSRISWDGKAWWDCGQKLFHSRTLPELFGFCGDVVLASSLLSQAVGMVDSGLLYDATVETESRIATLQGLLRAGLEAYPRKHRRAFSVLYCSRSTEDRTPAAIHVGQIAWSIDAGWSRRWLRVPDSSGLVVALGTGGDRAREWNERWKKSEVGGTSRAVFSGFCDHLRSGDDSLTGGPPQLVGVYRKGPARAFGIVSGAKPTYLGLPIPDPDRALKIEWRNELLELCDPMTGRRSDNAQIHVRPGTLS